MKPFNEVKKNCCPAAKHFAVTTHFRINITRVLFMSFKILFIDNDWILQNYCLDIVHHFKIVAKKDYYY